MSTAKKPPNTPSAAMRDQWNCRRNTTVASTQCTDERAGHGDAVGRGQRVGALECEHQDQHAHSQGRIDLRHVDLALLGGRRMAHRHARQEPELHALPGDRIGTRDHRLRGDHRRHCGKDHQRQPRPAGGQQEERISQRVGVSQNQCALAEIVQHQRRQHEKRPAHADRLCAEMPHVGIQRLGPGDAQHDGAEHHEGQHLVLDAQHDRVARRDRQQHERVPGRSRPRRAGRSPQTTPPSLARTAARRRSVPRHCTANSTTMTTALMGRMNSARPGAETSSPSTADSTEIAGVMTPSPKNRQAPAIPTSAMALRIWVPTETRCASAISARMPPSPWLSARMTRVTYLIVTISTSDQKISDRTPSISTLVIGCPGTSCRLARGHTAGWCRYRRRPRPGPPAAHQGSAWVHHGVGSPPDPGSNG